MRDVVVIREHQLAPSKTAEVEELFSCYETSNYGCKKQMEKEEKKVMWKRGAGERKESLNW